MTRKKIARQKKMKTFKDVLNEVYSPKAEGEKNFAKKHVVVKTPDASGNGDDVFNAKNIKAIDRKKDNHGYNPGEDEKVYEEVLDEGKMKLDKVHIVHHYDDDGSREFAKHYTAGNKGDHRPGGPTEKDEKASDAFHERYLKVHGKSGFAGSGHSIYKDTKTGHHWKVDRRPNGKTFYGTDHIISPHSGEIHEELLDEKYSIKSLGFEKVAVVKDGKPIKTFKSPIDAKNHISKLVKEEVESLEELSKSTLKSYVKQAPADSRFWDGEASGKWGPVTKKEQQKGIRKSHNRVQGVNKAVAKITGNPTGAKVFSKEETNLEEGRGKKGRWKQANKPDHQADEWENSDRKLKSVKAFRPRKEYAYEEVEEIDESSSRANSPNFRAAQKNLNDIAAGRVTHVPKKKTPKINWDKEDIKWHKESADHHKERHDHHKGIEKEHEDVIHELETNPKNFGFTHESQVHGAIDEMDHIREKHQTKRIHHEDNFNYHKHEYERLSGKKYKSKLKEEAQIDEISKKTLGSYITKASEDRAAKGRKYMATKDPDSKTPDIPLLRKITRRKQGIQKAVDKLTKEDVIGHFVEKYVSENKTLEEKVLSILSHLSESNMTILFNLFESLDEDNQFLMFRTLKEENGVNELLDYALQLDEISKKTLGSYIKKASSQAIEAQKYETHFNRDGDRNSEKVEKEHRLKREAGIKKAVDKLTKEETEVLEETSITKGDYTITNFGETRVTKDYGRPDHAVVKNARGFGLKHTTEEGTYGNTNMVHVKNNKTGITTHHHVYQSDYYTSKKKPIFSVRPGSTANSKHHAEHHNVLMSYLEGK